ncbi:MAG: DUF1648 domain-containing protein [Ferruginibacter sp.]|nr:DUF1648 domain-containing protein [Ferruginibacter sp.]
MTDTRPRIIIPITNTGKILEIAAVLLLLVLWMATIAFYFNLPQTIPIHYNAEGRPDDYGTKATIFILPAIATIIYYGLTQLNKYPHIFNYPTTITAENAVIHYTAATKMIRALKLIVVAMFLYINIAACLTALGKVNGLGWWFLPIMLIALFSVIVWYFWKVRKK